jgi:hypothetical protein
MAEQDEIMVPVSNGDGPNPDLSKVEPGEETIAYIRQMLGELRGVAASRGADMLCYLLEMAYVEAGDIMSGRRALSIGIAEGDHSAGMAVKPAGKIQL